MPIICYIMLQSPLRKSQRHVCSRNFTKKVHEHLPFSNIIFWSPLGKSQRYGDHSRHFTKEIYKCPLLPNKILLSPLRKSQRHERCLRNFTKQVEERPPFLTQLSKVLWDNLKHMGPIRRTTRRKLKNTYDFQHHSQTFFEKISKALELFGRF